MLQKLALLLYCTLFTLDLFKLRIMILLQRLDFALKVAYFQKKLLDASFALQNGAFLRSSGVGQVSYLLRLCLVLLLEKGLQLIRSFVL